MPDSMLTVLGPAMGQALMATAVAAVPHGAARTIKLLAAAAVSVAVAFAPQVIDRVIRKSRSTTRTFEGTELEYTPPPRRRPGMSRLTVGGLVMAAGLVAMIWLPPTKRPPLPALPPANAVAPGVAIGVNYSSGNADAMGCTAGFLVHTPAGQTAVLTAGHCNRAGGASTVVINYSAAHADVAIGTFQQTVNEGERGEDHDIGLVVLDGEKDGQTPAVTNTLPPPLAAIADSMLSCPVLHRICSRLARIRWPGAAPASFGNLVIGSHSHSVIDSFRWPPHVVVGRRERPDTDPAAR